MLDFFSVYAPKGDGDNDPRAYTKSVIEYLNSNTNGIFTETTALKAVQPYIDQMTQAMIKVESPDSFTTYFSNLQNNQSIIY